MNKLKKFFRASSAIRSILTEAVLFMYSARILLFLLPARLVLRICESPKREAESPDTGLLKMISWALAEVGSVSQGRNGCLVKSLAGRWMLHRRGIRSQLFFGVRINEKGNIVAHAWLTYGSVELVPAGEEYTILAGF